MGFPVQISQMHFIKATYTLIKYKEQTRPLLYKSVIQSKLIENELK